MPGSSAASVEAGVSLSSRRWTSTVWTYSSAVEGWFSEGIAFQPQKGRTHDPFHHPGSMRPLNTVSRSRLGTWRLRRWRSKRLAP